MIIIIMMIYILWWSVCLCVTKNDHFPLPSPLGLAGRSRALAWLVLMVFHSCRMVFQGFRFIFMVFQVSRLVFMVPGWFLWLFMALGCFFYGSRPVFMVPGWFFMIPGRFSWFFMVPGWFFMVPGQISWFFVVLYPGPGPPPGGRHRT